MWLPRASAAYQVNDGMVVKGGYGVYYDSLNATAITPNQLGFSTVTTVPSSNDFGQTWTSGNPRAGISPLVDPFPVRADGTRFSTPAGASLGGDFVAGQALNYGNLDREHARLQRWRAGVQKELGRNMAIEVAYVGTYSDDVDVSSFLGNTNNTQASVRQDILPAQYWNHTDTRNARSSDREQQKHHEPVFHRQPDGAACLESRAVQPAGRASLVHEPDDPEEPAVAAISSHERGERSPGTGVAARQGSHARRRSGVPAEVLSGSQPQRGVLGHPGRGVAERHQRIRRRANGVDDQPERQAASRYAQRRLGAAVRPRSGVPQQRRLLEQDPGRMADGPDVRMAAGSAAAVRQRVLLRRRRQHRARGSDAQ